MEICVRILHTGGAHRVQLNPGETLADALTKICYPKQGHGSWHAWVNGEEVPLNKTVDAGATVIISHAAMGEHIYV